MAFRMKNENRIDMVEGPLSTAILKYSVPIMLSGLLQLFYNTVGMIVVGRYCGRESIAAVGSSAPLINLIVNIFIGLSVGVGVRTAVSIGAQDSERCSKVVHTALPLATIGGALLALFGLLFSGVFLRWMKTPDDVLSLATTYTRIYFLGMVPFLIHNYGVSILMASGDSKRPLYYLAAAGVLNLVLNLIFVAALGMDVAGVALATVLSQLLSAFLVLRNLATRRDMCRFEISRMQLNRDMLGDIVKVGLPAGLQGSTFSITNVIIQASVNSFGSAVMAGNSAAGNLDGITYASMLAFHQSAMSFAGQNYGAKRYDRINKILRYCLLYVVLIGIGSGWGIYALGRPLLNIYIPGDEEAISYGLTRLFYISVLYFIFGMSNVFSGLLNGLGKTFATMLISVFNISVVRIIWIYTLWQIPKYHTYKMLFTVYPVTWTLSLIMMAAYYLIVVRKMLRREKNKVTNNV